MNLFILNMFFYILRSPQFSVRRGRKDEPGTAWDTKRIPKEYFAGLIRSLCPHLKNSAASSPELTSSCPSAMSLKPDSCARRDKPGDDRLVSNCMSNWIDFYDFKHSVIYVNARHRDVHYRTIAEDIRKLVPSPKADVLDDGWRGEGDLGRSGCCRLRPTDPGGSRAQCACLAHTTLRRPSKDFPSIPAEQAAALPKGSFDLIVMHSVAQYLSAAELDRLLAIFHSLLKPGGLIVLGDIVAAACCRAGGGAGTPSLRCSERILLGGGLRADADLCVRLFAAEENGRAVALRGSGHAGDLSAPVTRPSAPVTISATISSA